MFNVSKVCVVLLLMSACGANAAEGALNATLSLQRLWDDNLARTHVPQGDQINIEALGLGLHQHIQDQQFDIRLALSSFQHHIRTDLDGDLNQGSVNWNGVWNGIVITDLEGVREQHYVDQLEFSGNDIASRDHLKGKIGVGTTGRFTFFIGAQGIRQLHSNELRSGLDFNDQESFGEINYKTANESFLSVRLKSGQRSYTEQLLADDMLDKNFTYNQFEFETHWTFSPKTNVTALMGAFERKGVINNGSGKVSNIKFNWLPTEKLSETIGYEFSQPAIGEITDSPTTTSAFRFESLWAFTNKLTIGNNISYVTQHYDHTAAGLKRIESFYSAEPIFFMFNPYRTVQLRFDLLMKNNQSPLLYRDYISRSIGLSCIFKL